MRRIHLLGTLALGTMLAFPAGAQTVDYSKADLIRTSGAYIFGGTVYPSWLDDSVRFWYKSPSKADRGVVYLVDPRNGSRKILFDNYRMSAALSIASDTILNPDRFPGFKVVDDGKAIELSMFRKKPWRCEIETYKCVALDSAEEGLKNELKNGPSWASRSPDKKWDVFVYNRNLYVRPAALADSEARAKKDSILRAKADSGKKKDTAKKTPAKKDPKARKDSVDIPKGSIQLTDDGVNLYDYSASFGRSVKDTGASFKPARAFISWAPDSKKFSIVRSDYRGVRIYPIYSSTKDQPEDRSYYYAAASDSIIPVTDVHVVDVIEKKNVKVEQPSRSPQINFSPSPTWGATSDELFLLNSSRAYKRMTIFKVDTKTGKTTQVMKDTTATWFDYSLVFNGTFKAVQGQDIFWLSERDGFAHIYRYGPDGKLKNQVDVGPFMTRTISRVDSVGKNLYLLVSGKDPTNPYHSQLYKVSYDGGEMKLLTTDPGARSITYVPKAPYFIDSYSRIDLPSVTVLRSLEDGKVIMELARADVEYLRSIGWTPPEAFTVKARDGVTDLYGLMYKPSDFDPNKKYPIIDHIYPGPFTGSTRVDYAFVGTSEPRALAELGFIVIQLDHLGTPWRSTTFTQNYVNNMIDNGIPDHVAGIRQLAARYNWIDINKVGIYGHSGGGYASTDAMFTFPDFYKVAVSGAGNHHPNTYGHFWAERYLGLYDKAKYDKSANYTYAKNLKGKLLLMTGDMDTNVHPAATYKVIDALIKANKNFDMIIYPDAGHGLPDHSIRMRWNYFVRHLMGAEPPKDYQMMRSTFFF